MLRKYSFLATVILRFCRGIVFGVKRLNRESSVMLSGDFAIKCFIAIDDGIKGEVTTTFNASRTHIVP